VNDSKVIASTKDKMQSPSEKFLPYVLLYLKT